MTNEQYTTLLAVLADKVKEQGATIRLQNYEIERLQRKLAEAEGMEAPRLKTEGGGQ